MARAVEAHVQFAPRDAQGDFAGAGVAEAAGAQRDILAVGGGFDGAVIQGAVLGVEEVDRHGAAAGFGVGWAVNAHQRDAAAVLHRGQVVQQPAGQAAHPLFNGLYADGFDMAQADFNRRDVEVIYRAVFKGGVAFG